MDPAAVLLLLAIAGAAPEPRASPAPPTIRSLVLGSDLVLRGRLLCYDPLEVDGGSVTPPASAHVRVLLSITCAVTSRSLCTPDQLAVLVRVPAAALAASLEQLPATEDRVYFVVRHLDCFGGHSWYEFTSPDHPSLPLEALESLPSDPGLPSAPSLVQPSVAVPPCA